MPSERYSQEFPTRRGLRKNPEWGDEKGRSLRNDGGRSSPTLSWMDTWMGLRNQIWMPPSLVAAFILGWHLIYGSLDGCI